MASTYIDREKQGNATWDAPEKNGRNFRRRNSSVGGLKTSMSSFAVGSGYSIENLTVAAANQDVSSKMKRNNSSFMSIANKFGLKGSTPGSASQSPATLRNKTSSMLGLDRINMLSLSSSPSLQKLKLSDDEDESTKSNLYSSYDLKKTPEYEERLATIPPSSSATLCSESDKSDATPPQSNSVVGTSQVLSGVDFENNAEKSESDASYGDSGLLSTFEIFRANTANTLTFFFLIVTAIAAYTGYFETIDFSSDLKQVSLDSHVTQSTIYSMQGKVSGLNSLVGTLMNEAADLGEENDDDDRARSQVSFDHQVQFTNTHINRHIESKAMSYEKSTGELENIIVAMKKRVSMESKRKTKEKYGVGPYQVKLELENAPSDSFSIVIELQSLEYMPYSTFTFLEQVFYGLWREKEIISLSDDTLVVSAGHDIETFENLGLANLSFLENDSTRAPDQGTWSICFRNQGNTLYISKGSCKGTKFGVIHKDQDAVTNLMTKISNGSTTAMRIKDVSLLSPPVDANANARYLAKKMNNIFSSSSSSHILNSIKSWNSGKFPRISLEPSKSSSRIEMMTANEFYLQESGTESHMVMVQIEGEDEESIYLMMNKFGEKTFVEVSSSQDNDKIESDGVDNEEPFELAKLSQGEEYRLPEWESGEEDLVIKACPKTSTKSDTNASTDRQLMNDTKYQTVLIYVENVGTQPIC